MTCGFKLNAGKAEFKKQHLPAHLAFFHRILSRYFNIFQLLSPVHSLHEESLTLVESAHKVIVVCEIMLQSGSVTAL